MPDGNSTQKIDEFQHPDSIWTWTSSNRRGRYVLWIPYLAEIARARGKGAKGKTWELSYNGGVVSADIKRLDAVMLYGASGALPLTFLDDLGSAGVPLIIHRRNLANPYLFLPSYGRDYGDMLSAQIRCRDNQIKRAYIARTLVRSRFLSLPNNFTPIPSLIRRLSSTRSVDKIRNLESQLAQKYWKDYFAWLGFPRAHRRDGGPLAKALDACSFFLFGVLLRWVLLHRLSPCHGFLHVTTDFPSLIYDVMEPYRGWIESAVARAAADELNEEQLTAGSLHYLKDTLGKVVYTPMTRQYVSRKNLLHGVVLALRAYLAGDMPRLVIPHEGIKIGGRPPTVSYRIPGGRRAPGSTQWL